MGGEGGGGVGLYNRVWGVGGVVGWGVGSVGGFGVVRGWGGAWGCGVREGLRCGKDKMFSCSVTRRLLAGGHAGISGHRGLA